MSAALAIEATGLSKSYGEVRALDGIDLRLERGTVLGLLGPNGDGKTTAVRILTTLLPADGGSARSPASTSPARRTKIGLAGQYAAVDENLTGAENLEMGAASTTCRRASRARAAELLERFDLAQATRALPRRADHRPRPAQPHRPLGDDRRSRRRRHHRPAHHPVPGRARSPRPSASSTRPGSGSTTSPCAGPPSTTSFSR